MSSLIFYILNWDKSIKSLHITFAELVTKKLRAVID